MLQSIRVKIVSVLSYFCHSYYHHLDGIFSCFSIRPSSLCRFFSSCNFYRTQENLGSNSWVRLSVSLRPCVDLTDVTLADEDTNSILTDNANRAIQGNVAMQVTRSSGQFWNNANGATWCLNFEPMQIVPLGGPICIGCKWCLLVVKFVTDGCTAKFAINEIGMSISKAV